MFVDTYRPPTILPGARERIEQRVKDIPKINKERPCKNCIHYTKAYSIWHCALSSKDCDFYHSAFKPVYKTGENEN